MKSLFKVVDASNKKINVIKYFDTKKDAKVFRDKQNENSTLKSGTFRVGRGYSHWKGESYTDQYETIEKERNERRKNKTSPKD